MLPIRKDSYFQYWVYILPVFFRPVDGYIDIFKWDILSISLCFVLFSLKTSFLSLNILLHQWFSKSGLGPQGSPGLFRASAGLKLLAGHELPFTLLSGVHSGVFQRLRDV